MWFRHLDTESFTRLPTSLYLISVTFPGEPRLHINGPLQPHLAHKVPLRQEYFPHPFLNILDFLKVHLEFFLILLRSLAPIHPNQYPHLPIPNPPQQPPMQPPYQKALLNQNLRLRIHFLPLITDIIERGDLSVVVLEEVGDVLFGYGGFLLD